MHKGTHIFTLTFHATRSNYASLFSNELGGAKTKSKGIKRKTQKIMINC